ncbi:MAG: CocE/NonD family hydrolase, partial [Rhodothermales bacterium]|nr:CocE/NonD family hydrolase [Rhodothermales bacterium]
MNAMHRFLQSITGALLLLLMSPVPANGQEAFGVRANYTKYEHLVPMRDGVRLFTTIYVPKDQSEVYPFLIKRTPYSVSPYGNDNYANFIGPNGSPRFAEEGYIFVYQDVRGRFMSEGTFLNMTPHRSSKPDSTYVDESTDTYDTVDWLV